MKNEIENYQSQFSLLNKEIEKISEGKAKAEQNVEKLKENLREKLREIEILQ
jgi:flagellar biosynthesis chaperone FliJ